MATHHDLKLNNDNNIFSGTWYACPSHQPSSSSTSKSKQLSTSDQILAHSGIRWFWIFWYFERNVPLQLPRHYSLPLPRLKILTFLYKSKRFILFIFILPSTTQTLNVLKAGMEGDGCGAKLEGAGNPHKTVKHPPMYHFEDFHIWPQLIFYALLFSGVAKGRSSHWRRRKRLSRRTLASLENF